MNHQGQNDKPIPDIIRMSFIQIVTCYYKPGHDCLSQTRVCSEFPSQLSPVQLLLLVSVPEPHVTEQVHDLQEDQTTKSFH